MPACAYACLHQPAQHRLRSDRSVLVVGGRAARAPRTHADDARPRWKHACCLWAVAQMTSGARPNAFAMTTHRSNFSWSAPRQQLTRLFSIGSSEIADASKFLGAIRLLRFCTTRSFLFESYVSTVFDVSQSRSRACEHRAILSLRRRRRAKHLRRQLTRSSVPWEAPRQQLTRHAQHWKFGIADALRFSASHTFASRPQHTHSSLRVSYDRRFDVCFPGARGGCYFEFA